MALSYKQEAFVQAYCKHFNGTKAAIESGYSVRSARQIASRLLANDNIRARVKERIEELAMSADEVLLRLADQARGDITDLLDPASMTLDVKKAVASGKTHLIKKWKQTTITSSKGDNDQQTDIVEIELYDAQAALVHIGRHLQLFTDKVDVTTGGEKIIPILKTGMDIDDL